MSKQKKTRLIACCPCCGAEVTRPLKYWFMLVEADGRAMPKMSKFYTCPKCADVMLGDSETGKAKIMQSFADFAEKRMREGL